MTLPRLAALTVVLIAASTAYVSSNYRAAFPQASLRLPLSRDQITARAEAFLRTRALSTTGFREITTFDPAEEARLYLERELGLEEANRLMESTVPVWQWRARWFQPPQKEEILVWLSPEGRLTGFEHRVAEAAAGRRLDRPSARLLADAFLAGQTAAGHRLVSEETTARPNRDDHTFTFEQQGFSAKDAHLRRTIVIQGDRIGRYREFLHVPEAWERDFARLRSSNELYAAIANGLYALLGVAALVLLFQGIRRHQIPWQPLLRIAVVVSTFYLLNELNTLSFAIDALPTSSTYPEMLVLSLLQALGGACGVLLYVLMPAAAGAIPWSRAFPSLMPLAAAFHWRGLATRSFLRASLAGYAMAAGHMIFLTAFYLAGSRLGVWSPQDVDYSDVFATPLPWAYPLAIALMASTAEEFWFRLVAIPVVLRLSGSRWLAVILPAFVWGFLHATYPQQPGYIRGVEVGLIGVAAGVVMLRFGIVATLVWHYAIDAFLIGLPLLRAESWTYRVNGLLVALAIAAPLLVSLVLYRRNHGFLPEPETAPPPEEPRPQERLEAPDPAPAPLWPAKYLYLAAALVALASLVAQPETIGSFLRVRLDRAAAEEFARRQMRDRKLDPAQWFSTADFVVNLRDSDAEYLRQQVGLTAANRLIEERLPHAIWRVRFFQPGKPEEWVFYSRQSGELYRFDHDLDENARGAQLAPAAARQIAEAYAGRRHPIAGFTLVESTEDKHPNRTDHSFTWEDPSFRVGAARFRVSLQLVGDEPCEYRPHLKLPEEWLREHNRTRLASYLLPALIGAMGVPVVVALFRRLAARNQILHWRVCLGIGAAGGLLAGLEQLNSYPVWLARYDTSTPLNNFYLQLGTSSLVGVLLSGAALFAAVLAFDLFRQGVFPHRALPRPSIGRAVAVAILIAGGQRLLEWIRQQTPGPRESLPIWGLNGMDTVVPALSLFGGSWTMAVLAAALAATAVLGALLLLRRREQWILLATLFAVVVAGRVLTPAQIPFAAAATALMLGTAALIALTCSTDIRSIAVGLFWAMAAVAAVQLARQPLDGLRIHAALLAAAGLVAGLAVLRSRHLGQLQLER